MSRETVREAKANRKPFVDLVTYFQGSDCWALMVGNSYEIRETLKARGFKWYASGSMWVKKYAPDEPAPPEVAEDVRWLESIGVAHEIEEGL